jgi:hypothetical protein
MKTASSTLFFRSLMAVLLFLSASLASAQPAESGLYRVTTIRAAPGQWVALKALIEGQGEPGSVAANGRTAPYRLRHSQGDHWDFMLIQPMTGLQAYFADPNLSVESSFRSDVAALADFSEDWIVSGPGHTALADSFTGAGLYHVEMFRARAGMWDALIDQRQRENGFLADINEPTNAIFVGRFGADWDTMTIGFHASLASYAAGGGSSDAEADRAARANGFEGTGSIAPFLRTMLVGHNDTLAVPMD